MVTFIDTEKELVLEVKNHVLSHILKFDRNYRNKIDKEIKEEFYRAQGKLSFSTTAIDMCSYELALDYLLEALESIHLCMAMKGEYCNID